MLLRCTSFEQMREEIEERNKPIIIFGAGVIGTVTVSEILKQYNLMKRVLFYVDNSRNLQGQNIDFYFAPTFSDERNGLYLLLRTWRS